MNSTLTKRSYFSYALLNAITFGIYGVIIRSQIDNDINTVCASDGQQPEHSFGQAWIFSKLYNLMIAAVFGIPIIIGASIGYDYLYNKGIIVFLIGLVGLLIISFVFEGLYMPSWWYTQHNRLVLNSHRYKMVLNDNAFDNAVWKSIMFIPMNVFSFLGYGFCLAGLVFFFLLIKQDMAGFGILSVVAGYLIGAVCLFIKNIINLPLYYTLKSLNRFAENMGITYAGMYNPTGLLDDDNYNNIFSRIINVLNSFGTEKTDVIENDSKTVLELNSDAEFSDIEPQIKVPNIPDDGKIECVAGTNKGYIYNTGSGEELIIGKDPKTSNIVISSVYKDVSRKHCGIKYSAEKSAYIVTDYSSNGTKVNDVKLEPNKPTIVRKGSKIALGKGDNIFYVR